ncbi:hypothetical protein FRC00_002940 [Tulasnella sp. 408]|nr:hypothetical protein FRC00_002940 [Tulasnella sp. 408]
MDPEIPVKEAFIASQHATAFQQPSPAQGRLLDDLLEPPSPLYHERFQPAKQVTDHIVLKTSTNQYAGIQMQVGGWKWEVHLSFRDAHQIKDALEWLGISDNNNSTPHFEPPQVNFLATTSRPTATPELGGSDNRIGYRHLAPILSIQFITKLQITSLESWTAQMDLLSYLSEPQAPVQPSAEEPSFELSTEPDEAIRPTRQDLELSPPARTGDGGPDERSNDTTPRVQGEPTRLKRIEFTYESDNLKRRYDVSAGDGIRLYL